MKTEREQVAELIREAFAGIVLGKGIGLWQGQALDDYADKKTIAAYRARDEKTDWAAIPRENLNRCYSSLPFFDAEGMRFHLPAFLLAELEADFDQGVVFHLTDLSDYGRSKFALLSGTQRKAVREFLLLLKDDPSFSYEQSQIECALAEYWNK